MILVVGPGHSGTSNVCRVLNRYWGVCFGHNLGEDSDSGRELWEDKELKRLLVAKVARGKMDILDWKRTVNEGHGPECAFVGVKLIQFATHLGLGQLQDLEPELIVRTRRERESCIRSWMKSIRSYDAAADGYDRREQRLNFWADRGIEMLDIELDPEKRIVPDEEVRDWISGYWGVAPLFES